jgi:hypothetical protein
VPEEGDPPEKPEEGETAVDETETDPDVTEGDLGESEEETDFAFDFIVSSDHLFDFNAELLDNNGLVYSADSTSIAILNLENYDGGINKSIQIFNNQFLCEEGVFKFRNVLVIT